MTIIAILSIIAAILLVLIILIQNPKGGGLSSGFGAANQLGGVRQTTDFLEKATWSLAIAIVLLSMASAYVGSGTGPQGGGEIRTTLPEGGTQIPTTNNLPPGPGPEAN